MASGSGERERADEVSHLSSKPASGVKAADARGTTVCFTGEDGSGDTNCTRSGDPVDGSFAGGAGVAVFASRRLFSFLVTSWICCRKETTSTHTQRKI